MPGSEHDAWLAGLGVNVDAHRTSMRLPETDKESKKQAPVAKSPPAADKAKAAKPQGNGAPVATPPPQAAAVGGKKVLEAEMPFGTIKYFADWEKEVKPLLADANTKFLAAEAADTDLEDAWGALEAARDALGPVDAILAEIKANATEINRLQAGNAQDADIILESMTNTLRRIRDDVAAAKTELQITDDDRTVASKKNRAASLISAHEAIQKNFDLFLGAVDEAIGLATGGPITPAKVLGYTTKVTKLVESFMPKSPFLVEAEKLQQEAQAMESANLQKRFKLATDRLRSAGTHLTSEKAVFDKAMQKFKGRWESAEGKFDQQSKGRFRFESIRKAIELASRTEASAKSAIERQYAAEKAAKLLLDIPTDGKAGNWSAEPSASYKMLKEMKETMKVEPSVQKRDRASRLFKELTTAYDQIREELSAPG